MAETDGVIGVRGLARREGGRADLVGTPAVSSADRGQPAASQRLNAFGALRRAARSCG